MRVGRRWRPPLPLVLFGALFGTLALSFLGLLALRLAGPEIGFRNAALVIAAAIAVATGVLAWLLARLILGPVTALSRFAAEVRSGHGDAAPPGRFGTSELGDLGASVVGMARALRRREASLRAFADHATHEIKTPVSTIRAAAEMLAEAQALPDHDRALVAGVSEACAQIEAQLDALRRVARAREPVHHGQTTLAAVAPRLDAGGLVVALGEGARLPLPLAEEGLRIVLQEIARNAAQHGAGRLELSALAGPVVVVQDDGPGVSPGHADRVFEPFFTSRRGEGDAGMGLAIASALLAAHDASIRLAPSAVGARFEIVFGASA